MHVCIYERHDENNYKEALNIRGDKNEQSKG